MTQSFPVIDAGEEILKNFNPEVAIGSSPIQKDKGKKQWKPCYTMTSISTPTKVESDTIKKKFRIQFKYYDHEKKKQRNHSVFFGTDTDYIFTGNRTSRIRKLTTMKNMDNPFSSNYWAAWLTNKYDSMQKGFIELQHYLLDTQKPLTIHRRAKPQPLGNTTKDQTIKNNQEKKIQLLKL